MHIPKWRKATWAIAIWTALMFTWAIVGGGSAASSCSSEQGDAYLSASTAQSACQAGTGIGIAIILVLWFVGFIVLALIWLMSRPKPEPTQQIVYVQAPPAGAQTVVAGPAPAAPAQATGYAPSFASPQPAAAPNAFASSGGLDELPVSFDAPR